MEKRLIYSELKEIVYTLSEYEIQQAILKQIHETGHKGLTFEFDYDEDGGLSGATITFHYKHIIGKEK